MRRIDRTQRQSESSVGILESGSSGAARKGAQKRLRGLMVWCSEEEAQSRSRAERQAGLLVSIPSTPEAQD
ncbi:hypothetical protein NDU88_007971 [Pleurodeles waltl]|uniref:Uncharacterized protein n=1 Tax=Pleurodeles waltl TaxID=8319 RepID=A0AAV7SUH3_PLEWA|nr:hypothetical protein NDU88_007971 [Pleurodeles waltl]